MVWKLAGARVREDGDWLGVLQFYFIIIIILM